MRPLGTDLCSLRYNVETRTGVLYLPPYCCTDMDGAIAMFQNIDPNVARIVTVAGVVEDTVYEQIRGKWTATLPRETEWETMRLKTEFFKNGDAMAIRTNAATEDEFIDSAAVILDRLIEGGKYDHDWDFQLTRWLRQIVDITCKLRGYKADVDEQRVLTAGDVTPAETDRVGVADEATVA